MKARTLVSICLVASAMAWAQTTPPSQKVADKPAAKPAAQAAAKPTAAQPAPRPVAKKPAAPVATKAKPPAAKPAAQPAVAQKPAAAQKPAVAQTPAATQKPTVSQKPTAKPAIAKAPAKKPVAKPAAKAAALKAKPAAQLPAPKAAAKRDPFVNPIRTEGPTGPNCTTGKKCLAIDAIDLKGIVKYQAGMIAVVESSTRKVTYFLRENDPVFNGYVVKITGDSITFRENVMDRLGRQSTRDIVKKVVAPAV